ncbi:MAG: c-type cytochrome [Methyloprofundus sp.]|nr:c-type cytochrome [Methyloprofundus sp.]
MIVTFLVLVGCSGKPTTVAQEQMQEAVPELVVIKPHKLTKGEALYLRNCADCHGWEGHGNGAAAEYMDAPVPALQQSKLLSEASESQFIDWVLSGSVEKIQIVDKVGLQTDSEVALLLAYMRRLNSIDWSEVGADQEVYDQLCANCHGLYGRGDGDFAVQMPVSLPDLSAASYQNQHSDAELVEIITQGKHAMPGMGDVLSVQEIKRVTAFMRLFSPGYESYDRFCAACHSSDGMPVEFLAQTGESREIQFEQSVIPVFDKAYLAAHTDQQLAPKVQHMLNNTKTTMLHFSRELQADEVRLIYQYLRRLAAQSL